MKYKNRLLKTVLFFYVISLMILNMINENTQAMPSCNNAIIIQYFAPSSLFIVDMAATQGVYSNVKTSIDTAPDLLNSDDKPKGFVTVSVDTMLSLAANPLSSAVIMCQSPNPIGLNTGTRTIDKVSKILLLFSETICKLNEKLLKNQIATLAINIIVKALLIKSFAFS